MLEVLKLLNPERGLNNSESNTLNLLDVKQGRTSFKDRFSFKSQDTSASGNVTNKNWINERRTESTIPLNKLKNKNSILQ